MSQYRADTPRASGVKARFLPTLARFRIAILFSTVAVDNCASPCPSAGRATTDTERNGATCKCAGFSRLVAPVLTYSAPPVAGRITATAAASSSCGTYAPHRTKPNVGRAQLRCVAHRLCGVPAQEESSGVGIAFVATAALAQEPPGRPAGEHNRSDRPEQNAPGVLSLLPGDAITEHSIDTAGGKLTYTATAGTFSLFDRSGERSAAVFYTAYVAKSNDPRRSLTFVFNGGPGAASAFLNLGLVGPRIAEFGMGGHDARMSA